MMPHPPTIATWGRVSQFVRDSLEGGRYYGVWLMVVLFAALLPYVLAIPDLMFGQPYVAQNDSRHYVVFLRRLGDPGLYANDFIADNFLAVTPWLYRALYRPFMAVGIDPVVANLWVFTPLTAVVLGAAAYRFFHRCWPSPIGAAVATVILLQLLGARDGLPHDFGHTIVLVLLVEFLALRAVTISASMVAATGILPVPAATTGITMAFLMLSRRFPWVTRDRKAWLVLVCAGIAAVIGGAATYAETQTLGGTFTIEEARNIPLFNPRGRREYFGDNFFTTYICNHRAGILPMCDPVTQSSPFTGSPGLQVAWAILVPIVIVTGIWFTSRPGTTDWLRRGGLPGTHPRLPDVIASLVAAGIPLFVISHIVAFELHLPERFSRYTIGIAFQTVIGLTVGVAVVLLVQRVISLRRFRIPLNSLLVVNCVLLLFISARSIRSRLDLVRPDAPAIHDYLRGTPKNTVVAGVMPETQFVPLFGWRSISAGLKYMVPFKRQFYHENAARMTGLASSLYGANGVAFAAFRERGGIDYVLVERAPQDALSPMRVWAANFPSLGETLARLERGQPAFFHARLQVCERASEAGLILADARCLVEPSREGSLVPQPR